MSTFRRPSWSSGIPSEGGFRGSHEEVRQSNDERNAQRTVSGMPGPGGRGTGICWNSVDGPGPGHAARSPPLTLSARQSRRRLPLVPGMRSACRACGTRAAPPQACRQEQPDESPRICRTHCAKSRPASTAAMPHRPGPAVADARRNGVASLRGNRCRQLCGPGVSRRIGTYRDSPGSLSHSGTSANFGSNFMAASGLRCPVPVSAPPIEDVGDAGAALACKTAVEEAGLRASNCPTVQQHAPSPLQQWQRTAHRYLEHRTLSAVCPCPSSTRHPVRACQTLRVPTCLQPALSNARNLWIGTGRNAEGVPSR